MVAVVSMRNITRTMSYTAASLFHSTAEPISIL